MTEQIDQLAQLDEIQSAALDELGKVQDEAGMTQWKTKHLGRSSAVMQVFSQIPQAPKEIRPALGQRANQVKQALEAAYAERNQAISAAALKRSLEAEKLDVTLPGRQPEHGRLHPQTQILREIYHVFSEMGFQVYRTPDVETDEMNFQLLNFPPYHPARDMQDSFYFANSPDPQDPLLLRTHTSPGQVRSMRTYSATNPDNPPPVRLILPGMCYRYEQVTARSETQFTQVEVIAVGKNIRFSDLKGTLIDFARRMFNPNVRTRFRPSYFPFTEPSAELDIECFVCGGKGCPVCKNSGWLEILGSGMIHPTVLKNGGYDPKIYSGFAAGMGPERIAMLRYRIEDIRNFWANDLRFLEQF